MTSIKEPQPETQKEKKQLTGWNVFWISLGSLIILLMPLWIYMGHLAKNGLSGSPEQWGQFGDFFGGVLNPIISLLTLAITIIIAVRLYQIERRYHHDTVKPYFTIKTGNFFSSNISAIPPAIDADRYSYNPSPAPLGQHDDIPDQFLIKFINRGLGVATEVVVTFEIAVAELNTLLQINNPNIQLTTGDIKTDEEDREFIVLNIQSILFNHHGGMKILAVERSGLGTIEQNKKKKIPIPSQIMTAFKIYNIKRRLGQPIEQFPTIFVTLDYKNIHDVPLNAKFRVGLFHVQDYLYFSRFKLLAEPI